MTEQKGTVQDVRMIEKVQPTMGIKEEAMVIFIVAYWLSIPVKLSKLEIETRKGTIRFTQ